MELKKIGYYITLISTIVFFVIIIGFLVVDSMTGDYELRGIVFGTIMYGIIIIAGGLVVFSTFIEFKTSVIRPTMFFVFSTMFACIAYQEMHWIMYVLMLASGGSFITLLGYAEQRWYLEKKGPIEK